MILYLSRTLKDALTGPSDLLKDLLQGYHLQKIIYHLDGGKEAQKYFRTEQITQVRTLGLHFKAQDQVILKCLSARDYLHFKVDNAILTGIPSSCELRLPRIQQVSDADRY
jgi:hypothetical protein